MVSRRGAQARRVSEENNLLATAIRVLGRVSRGGFDLTSNFAADNLPIVHYWRDGF
jgi:hypothetical protein